MIANVSSWPATPLPRQSTSRAVIVLEPPGSGTTGSALMVNWLAHGLTTTRSPPMPRSSERTEEDRRIGSRSGRSATTRTWTKLSTPAVGSSGTVTLRHGTWLDDVGGVAMNVREFSGSALLVTVHLGAGRSFGPELVEADLHVARGEQTAQVGARRTRRCRHRHRSPSGWRTRRGRSSACRSRRRRSSRRRSGGT